MRRMRHVRALQVQGCYLTLDASLPETLYDATVGGSLVAANGSVARWSDLGPNTWNATQGTAGRQPLRRAGGINGLDALEFDGTDDRLGFGATTMFRNQSYGLVLTVHMADTSAVQKQTFSNSTATGVTRTGLATNAGPIALMSGRRLDADSGFALFDPSSHSVGVAVVQTGIFDWANSDMFLRVNGDQVAVDTAFSTSGSTSNTNANTGFIGAGVTGATENYDGKIGEVACYNAALSEHVIRRLEHSRMRKWRISS